MCVSLYDVDADMFVLSNNKNDWMLDRFIIILFVFKIDYSSFWRPFLKVTWGCNEDKQNKWRQKTQLKETRSCKHKDCLLLLLIIAQIQYPVESPNKEVTHKSDAWHFPQHLALA